MCVWGITHAIAEEDTFLDGGLVERSKHLLTRPVNCPIIVQELRQNLSQVKTTMEREIHACPPTQKATINSKGNTTPKHLNNNQNRYMKV